MQHQVPQFIEVEDKIFGPLTWKQFVYLAGGVGTIVIFASFLPLSLALVFAAPFVVLALALAFYKVNDRPFIEVLEAGVSYMMSTKLYIWEKREPEPSQQSTAEKSADATRDTTTVPAVSQSKLRDLAWSLDIKDNLYADVSDPRERAQKNK